MEELQATQEELARRQKEYDRSNWLRQYHDFSFKDLKNFGKSGNVAL
jgi:hypothetical protein